MREIRFLSSEFRDLVISWFGTIADPWIIVLSYAELMKIVI